MQKVVRFALTLCAALTLAVLPARADVTLAGSGTATARVSSTICSYPLTIVLKSSGNDFVFSNDASPGQAASASNPMNVAGCAAFVPVFGTRQYSNRAPTQNVCTPGNMLNDSIAPSSLKVSGTTSTLTTTYHLCDGSTANETITLVTGMTTIAYTDTYVSPRSTIKVTATLTKIASA